MQFRGLEHLKKKWCTISRRILLTQFPNTFVYRFVIWFLMDGLASYVFFKVLLAIETPWHDPRWPPYCFHWQTTYASQHMIGWEVLCTCIVMYSNVWFAKSSHAPGARFTNVFLPAIQIRWKLRLVITPLPAIRSQQLSCHVQNFVAIIVLELRWEWNEISIKFELRWKNC